MTMMQRSFKMFVVGGVFALQAVVAPCVAQELSPRAYWPAPEGTRAAVIGYAHSSGDVVTDPSLPVTGVDSSLHQLLLAYFHTTSLFGRTSNIVLELPYVRGTTEGLVEGEPATRRLSSFGDIGITLGINLIGAPAMSVAEFQALRQKPSPILGASLKVILPSGAYEADRLINVGGNRWAVKAELGYIHPLTDDWHLEIEAGSWFFGDNDDFLGATRQQDPVFASELHLIRRFPRGRWISLQANYFTGGRSTVDGIGNDDLQRNSNLGATLLWPTRRGQALKFGFSIGAVTRSGGDYRTLLVSYIAELP